MLQQRPGDPETCEQRREAATNPQDEQRYLFAPASSSDPAVLLDAFERCFTTVRTQDAPYLIGSMIRSRVAGPQIWRSMTNRWSDAIELFPAGSPAAMASGLSSLVTNGEFAAEIRAFHESHPLEIGQQQVAQILDVMDLNAALATRNATSLEGQLRSVLA
jgi:hypothetical protein